MPKFKVSASKKQKKYTIVLNADSADLAKEKVHSEGYSILAVKEIDASKIEGHKFYFEAIDKDGGTKKGKVVANDPFKVYTKLTDGLGYDVKFLYGEENKDESEGVKLELIQALRDQYKLYSAHRKKNLSDNSEESKKEVEVNKKNLDNFYLKKELDETYRLIDFVLIKLKKILDKANDEDVNQEKKDKLQKLYYSIVKVKKTTNVVKLKEIGELALTKIGEIELSILEKYKDVNSKKLLKETNQLLKKIGSKEHFIEKEKDITYILHKFGEKIKEKFLFKSNKKNKEELDKESASYWKTVVLIEKYTGKLKENNKSMLKQFYVFIFPFGKNKEKANNLKLRKKVIKQNIAILKAKATGKLVSYTKLISGYNEAVHLFILLLNNIGKSINVFIYIASILLIIYFSLQKLSIVDLNFIKFNLNGILVLIYIIILNILITFIRGIKTIGLNIALYIFLLILGVVNF